MLPEIEYICPTQQLHHIEALESACGGEENVNHNLNSRKHRQSQKYTQWIYEIHLNKRLWDLFIQVLQNNVNLKFVHFMNYHIFYYIPMMKDQYRKYV